ncbi:glutathionylspermidine synthase family protein [Aquimarina sp. TRL1]|uniref:glutathionylspermidine synthase family protein n=1 Tax=Aquimarina sp. (strain TRL1) TaxID=2736252 RepID=UPI00158BB186|nr:glutathionylspermidine synthase family protein [Aquimarina sp. TRL1]QKX04770.1 glutathionylspermidine synthase family protein [Aquimarina sp. TRL1]
MVKENLLDPLEDSRFKEIKRLKKKHVPHQLHWYLKEDYFSEELLGVYPSEIHQFTKTAEEAYQLFEKATAHIIANDALEKLQIPSFFKECIVHSWNNRKKHAFLYGRFDLNAGFNNTRAKVIEFNADTCSTLPETIFWQPLQLEKLGNQFRQYNTLERDITESLKNLRSSMSHEKPVFLASTFGYKEDILNANCVMGAAYKAGYEPFYCDLEQVVFSEEEGIFYEVGGEYQPVDVWFKIVPWDWMFTEEPELAKTLATIVQKELCVVLNPAYTAIWQNKKFLAYITEHFPNQVIAETYLTEEKLQGRDYVSKPIYGRLGENVTLSRGKEIHSKGDYGQQSRVYQRFYPLVKDKEEYYYQTGVVYTQKPSAINFRTQESPIITDDCEFMSHFIW